MNYFRYILKLSEFNSIVKRCSQNIYGNFANKSHNYSEPRGTDVGQKNTFLTCNLLDSNIKNLMRLFGGYAERRASNLPLKLSQRIPELATNNPIK